MCGGEVVQGVVEDVRHVLGRDDEDAKDHEGER